MFGVGPKQFARIASIERVMASRARGSSWREAAYELGFFDQAHMINEFTEIVGVPPAELVRQEMDCGKDTGTRQSAAKSR
jgi:methylphosphotriester-DNA--protein-cysteine methyltransferase